MSRETRVVKRRNELQEDQTLSHDEASTSLVKSLQKAMSLLRLLGGARHGLNLSELAQLAGLPVSTTHRLLTTMQASKFVRFDGELKTWQIGVEVYSIGNAFVRSRDLAQLARPFLRRLMEKSGETANLYVRDGGEIVCISQCECRQVMRAIARPGGRVLMHCSGAGKAILSRLPQSEIISIVKKCGLRRITAHTIHSIRVLQKEIEATSARGYAIDDEENAIGLRCVAAAIVDVDNSAIAAISVSGPSARLKKERLSKLGPLVSSAAQELSEAIGGTRHVG